MLDEEKKAVEHIKESPTYRETILLRVIKKQSKEIEHWKAGMRIVEKDKNNHIERLEKEIEELKEDRDKFKKALGKRITYCNELEKDLFENCSNYVVSKDKIRLKMKQEMDKGYRLSEERHLQNYAYDRLKELLEE